MKMTTIVAIHYIPRNGETDKEAIVFASDVTGTVTDLVDKGDIIYKERSQLFNPKIIVPKDGAEGMLAIGQTGKDAQDFIRAAFKQDEESNNEEASSQEACVEGAQLAEARVQLGVGVVAELAYVAGGQDGFQLGPMDAVRRGGGAVPAVVDF